METLLNCGFYSWAMMTGVVAIYGVTLLGGAALIKYLFFTGQSPKAA